MGASGYISAVHALKGASSLSDNSVAKASCAMEVNLEGGLPVDSNNANDTCSNTEICSCLKSVKRN